MDGESARTRSMAPVKNRTNDRKAFCILYLSVMASASIAVAVQAMDESADSLTAVVHDLLLGVLYTTSTCVMIGATVYFSVKKYETFEAAQRSTEPVSFIVKYSGLGEPVNLYLRLGLAMFAAMSISQSVIKFQEMKEQPNIHWPEVFKSAFELGFFIAQTMFILIYHRIVILHNNEIFGACLIHVLSTNLCMWSDIMVDKVRTTLHLDTLESHLPSSTSVSFYLLPAVSEYCLLSAALIYEITVRIGQPSYIELQDCDDQDDSEDDEQDEDGEESKADSHGAKAEHTLDVEGHAKTSKRARHLNKRSCSRLVAKYVMQIRGRMANCGVSIKSGYWAPLLIVLTVSALAIATGLSPKTEEITPWKCAVLFTEEMFLNCIGIFVTLASFFKIRHLKFTIASRQSVIDEFVLYIAFFFSANYLVATVALASYLNRIAKSSVYQDLMMARLALNILELIEVVLQTYLIQDCFRRCSEEEYQQRMKPGRQMIAVLLGTNLAGWVVKSFQLKEADILYNITNKEEGIAYGWVLIAITMPVYLFYRYHCTVCLSQAFTMVYEDETRRFEALWRQNPIYLSNLLSHTNLAMSGEDNHIHARSKSSTTRLSGRRLNELLHSKFSSQSIQQLELMMPRRASFFHPGNLPASSSVHDIDSFYTSYPGMYSCPVPAMHKLSVPCSHKTLSSINTKRLSAPGTKVPARPNYPTRGNLAESESFEGPNYFLSRISPIVNISSFSSDNPGQHAFLPYDQRQPTHLNPHQYHTKSVSRSHANAHPATESIGTSPIPQKRATVLKNKSTNPNSGTNDGTMQRRQTLVNLETAKNRFLAAELAHKRVLERSGEIGGENAKKRASKGKRKRGTVQKPPGTRKTGSLHTDPSPQSTHTLFLNTQSSSQTPNAYPLSSPPPPARGFEPSKMVPLMMARSLANQSEGGLLSVVPEEVGLDIYNTHQLAAPVHTSIRKMPIIGRPLENQDTHSLSSAIAEFQLKNKRINSRVEPRDAIEILPEISEITSNLEDKSMTYVSASDETGVSSTSSSALPLTTTNGENDLHECPSVSEE